MNCLIQFDSNALREVSCEIAKFENSEKRRNHTIILPEGVICHAGVFSVLRDHAEAVSGLSKIVAGLKEADPNVALSIEVVDEERAWLMVGVGGTAESAEALLKLYFDKIVETLTTEEIRRIGAGARLSVD